MNDAEYLAYLDQIDRLANAADIDDEQLTADALELAEAVIALDGGRNENTLRPAF